MKKLSAIFAIAMPSLAAFGQGTVNFASIGSQVFCSLGVPAPVGALTVGLYYGIAGTIDPLTMSLLQTTSIGPVAGRFIGGTVTTPATTAPGASAVFEIRAWSGGFASYEAALASGDPTVLVGVSGLFNNATGGGGVPPGPPQSLIFPNVLVGNFQAPCVPEPATTVLLLLGAAGLLLHRSRRAH